MSTKQQQETARRKDRQKVRQERDRLIHLALMSAGPPTTRAHAEAMSTENLRRIVAQKRRPAVDAAMAIGGLQMAAIAPTGARGERRWRMRTQRGW